MTSLHENMFWNDAEHNPTWLGFWIGKVKGDFNLICIIWVSLIIIYLSLYLIQYRKTLIIANCCYIIKIINFPFMSQMNFKIVLFKFTNRTLIYKLFLILQIELPYTSLHIRLVNIMNIIFHFSRVNIKE